ncbi:hypothetical protein [Jiangella alkaliphila]|uniref:Uncharacterized protein n=1 Tax=Jiangella alkaliphila TaxID=419479 RepID=A0A1H2KFS9_9ACTN|nr:hypothetical protein [Jiangella alkaliphila]SDU67226.1 hypothetical protein SAMN04488563_3754 [Jiangella alkaliphila]
MTDRTLKEMFREALAGEPADDGPVHEDIARGRSRRRRAVRRRAAGGVVAVAAVAAGLLVPSLADNTDLEGQVRQPTTSVDRRGHVAPDVSGDPLRLAIWAAVDAALPEDVRLRPGTSVVADGHGPGLRLDLERGDVGFELRVLLQNAPPDLPGYQLCDEYLPLFGDEWADATGCETGLDEEGRWRGVEAGADDGLLFLEGDPASVTVIWQGTSLSHPPDEPPVMTAGPMIPDVPWFGVAEADAVADAVWAAAAQYDPAELASGIDLEATAGAGWPAIEAVLEEQFGPLTVVDPVDGDIVTSVDGVQVQAGMITADYRTADGAEVEVIIWQRNRPYELLCLDVYHICETMPELYIHIGDGPVGPDSTRRVGQRGSVRVQVNSTHRGLEMPVSRSVAGIMPLLSLIG